MNTPKYPITMVNLVRLVACVCFVSASAQVFAATTRTWTGADANSPTTLNDATNWSGNTLPSPTTGDTAQWDGTVAGSLSLTYASGLTGGPGDPGLILSLTSGQTGDLAIDSSSGVGIRISNVTNSSSSAAFTIGGTAGGFNLTLGGNPGTHTWINNSSATATIGSDVQFNVGGGGVHTLLLGGAGNWAINTYLANANTGGSLNITKNNAGTLTLNNAAGALGGGPAGTLTINTGTVQLLNATPFVGGSTPAYNSIGDGLQYGGVTVNTNGLLDLNGNSINVNALNGASGTIDTVSGGAVTLTIGVNGDNGSSFSGTITNSAGSVALIVTGTNTLALSGTNGYTGGTTVNGGTLLVNGKIAGNVTVASAGSFGGSGTIPGNVDWSAAGSTVTLIPNQPLTLLGNATLNNNTVVVNVPGASPLAGGTYTLMTYTPANVTGTLNSTPVMTGAGAVAGTYSISMSGGTVTLTIISTTTVGTWMSGFSGNWSVATNWSSNPNVPHVAKDVAVLGAGTNFITVTLDAPESVGSLSFTNAGSFAIANAGNTLTLDNSGSSAAINVTLGASNVIGAPIFLNDNTTVTITPAVGATLSLTNVISGASGKTLTVANGGVLKLYGNNTYGPSAGSVGTTLSAGTLSLGNSHSLGAGDLSVSGNSTVQFSSPMTLANNIQIAAARTLTLNDGGNNVTLGGAISGGGSITYTGTGTMTIPTVSGIMNQFLANAGHLVVNGGAYTNLNSISNSVVEVASGTVTLYNTTGTVTTPADNGGTSTIDSGATVNCALGTAIAVGNTSGSTNVATLNVYGTLMVSNATFLIARNGVGVVNLYNGGLITVAAPGKSFQITQNAAGGTFNLNGGTLVTGAIGNSNPSTTNAVFNFNGGTLKATNTTATAFWNNLSYMRVYVRNGGGTLDNNGINITNRQSFLHTTNTADNAIDGGMIFKGTGLAFLSGVTNTYTGPTVIAAGTVALTNSVFYQGSTLSISNGAMLQLLNPTTNIIGGLVLGGVSQPAGVYNQDNVSSYITGLGALQVVPSGPIAPTNSPTITQISLANVGPSGGNIIINGTNGNSGATYYLLASTNVAKPLAQWKTVATNVAAGNNFTFNETNAVTAGAGQQFYILSSTNYNP